MNASGSRPELRVEWIEHPRGDGMGRALALECKASGLTIVLDDPASVRALIDELVRALSWFDESVERAWT
jgi:hypothetical protein